MAGIDRRGALRLVGAAGLAGGLASACTTGREDEPTDPLYENHVRIGVLVPAAGGFRAIGDDIVNGFQRYLTDNDNRLGGHPYVLHQEDEGESSDDAAEGLGRLLSHNVQAVVGLATSAAVLGASATADERNLPVLGANASPQEVTGGSYLWRTSYVNQEPGEALGGHLATAGRGPVLVVGQDDPAGTDAVAGLREAFAVAGASDRLTDPILTPAEGEPGEGFFTETLDQLRLLDSDADVFAAYAGSAAVAFVKQYLDAGFEPQRLYGPADLTEGGALDELGGSAVGIRTVANYAPELEGAANRSFTVAYQAEFDHLPTVYAVAGYDAAVALDRAVRLTEGSPTRHQINLMLGEIGLIDSPRGPWQFNQGRTPTQKWYLREVAADGPVLSNVVIQELGTLG